MDERSLLLVDNEPWALFGLQQSCDWAAFGFTEVHATTFSSEAFSILGEKTPRLVISDIRMPDYTGLDLLRYVGRNKLPSEVIFISGFSDFEYAQQAVNNAAFAYLLKPIDTKVLRQTMERLCEKWREQECEKRPEPPSEIPSGYVNENFIDLLRYVNLNFIQNITLAGLSGKYHLNQTYISDLFRKTTGRSFSTYLKEIRIGHASELLKSAHVPIQDVARLSGYNDYGNFVRAFKKIHGITPARYRGGEEP